MGSVTSEPLSSEGARRRPQSCSFPLFVYQGIRGGKLRRKAALWYSTSNPDTSQVENLEMKIYFKDLLIIFLAKIIFWIILPYIYVVLNYLQNTFNGCSSLLCITLLCTTFDR